jgi:hypothetical protein
MYYGLLLFTCCLWLARRVEGRHCGTGRTVERGSSQLGGESGGAGEPGRQSGRSKSLHEGTTTTSRIVWDVAIMLNLPFMCFFFISYLDMILEKPKFYFLAAYKVISHRLLFMSSYITPDPLYVSN